MKRYLLILKLFLKAKFIFKNPPKHKLVVFDDESVKDLENFIFHYNFFILQSRIENINKIYFSFKILNYFFKYYNGNVMTAYLASLLEIINPMVVLTNIDNSLKFFDLARILEKKMNFVAIQNAARYDINKYKFLYKKNINKSDDGKKFYIPNFLCFGQFEIDHYRQHKIKVKNFFKIGSLRLANFFSYVKKNKIKLKKTTYDICLISERATGYDGSFRTKGIEKGFAKVVKFTVKFCRKHDMKLIFAKKKEKAHLAARKIEIDFFKKYLNNDEFKYITNNSLEKTNKYTSYKAMFQSRVAVGNGSTMLREKLSVGEKILSCNLTPTNIYNFPIEGICSIKNCNFQQFEKRLLKIYSMSKKNYFSKMKKSNCYTAAYEKKNSTIKKIKIIIDYFLADKNLEKYNYY